MLSLQEIVYEYEQVITGKKKYLTNDLFQDKDTPNEDIIITLFKYVIENMLCLSPYDAYNYLNKDLICKMKLDTLLKYIKFPPEFHPDFDLFYIVAKCYPDKFHFDFKERTLVMYKRLIERNERNETIISKFPKGFFDGRNGERRALICLKYAINTYCHCSSIEDLYKFFSSVEGQSFLKKYRLSQPCSLLFEFPVDYLHASFTTEKQKEYEFIYAMNRFDTYRKMIIKKEKEAKKQAARLAAAL